MDIHTEIAILIESITIKLEAQGKLIAKIKKDGIAKREFLTVTEFMEREKWKRHKVYSFLFEYKHLKSKVPVIGVLIDYNGYLAIRNSNI